MNKADWGDGPWIDEPDEAEWVDDATGLPCRATRNPELGYWDGYVGIELPWGPYREDLDLEINAHGGLTHMDKHDDGLWWLGFDCARYDDLVPGMLGCLRAYGRSTSFVSEHAVYRTLDYVKAQCAGLARQLFRYRWVWRDRLGQDPMA